jgi:hypothetical protein
VDRSGASRSASECKHSRTDPNAFLDNLLKNRPLCAIAARNHGTGPSNKNRKLRVCEDSHRMLYGYLYTLLTYYIILCAEYFHEVKLCGALAQYNIHHYLSRISLLSSSSFPIPSGTHWLPNCIGVSFCCCSYGGGRSMYTCILKIMKCYDSGTCSAALWCSSTISFVGHEIFWHQSVVRSHV